MPLLTPDDIRATLPRVGDELMRKPTYYYGFYSKKEPIVEQPCVVVYVHSEHLWYSVQFKKSGIINSYKLPDIKVGPLGGLPR